VGQMAVMVAPIEAVADDEAVRKLEAVVGDGDIEEAAVGAVEEDADLEAGGAAQLEVTVDVAEREAGVHDIFDDEHVAADDALVEVFGEAHGARGSAGGVAR